MRKSPKDIEEAMLALGAPASSRLLAEA